MATMSYLTYTVCEPSDKPLVWLDRAIKTPPLSGPARIEAGFLLRRLQKGELLGLPHSRPLPQIGTRCHELRIPDGQATWRIVYRIDPDAVVIVSAFSKKTPRTPKRTIDACRKRLRDYDDA